MKEDLKSKFLSHMKAKEGSKAEEAGESPADESAEESSPMYDLACKLCTALGVSEDKADEVADLLHEFKSME